MSWYRDDDGKIITDEEFEDDCCNCSAFCSEGTITVPCNGERTDCPYFKEVDTSEYDKKIRAKAIDEFAEKIKKKGIEDNWNCNDFYGDSCGVTSCEECENDFLREIDEIAEQLKAGAENEDNC